MLKASILKVGLKNTSYLISGNVLGQILGVIFTIYIARKLGPNEYGVYNTVAAFVAMFGFLTFGGYKKVLIRECSGQTYKLQNAIVNIFALKIILSLVAVGTAIASSFFFNYETRITILISIFAFTLLFRDTTNIIQVVFHSHNQLKYQIYSAFLQRLIYIIPTAICIYLGGGVEFVVTIFTLSRLLNIFFNYFFANKHFSFKIDIKKLRFLLDKRLFKQAMVFSFLGFIVFFYSKIDIAMLSWFTDQRSVGIYSAGYRLIEPFTMVGNMLALSFFPLTVARFRQGTPVKVRTLFISSLTIGAVLATLSVFVSLFSKDIVSIIYGDAYEGTGLVLKYLCWVIPLSIVTQPFVLSVQANHLEKKLIIPNILRALSNVSLNYIFIRRYGMMGVVYSTIITYLWYFIFVNFGYQYWILKRAGKII